MSLDSLKGRVALITGGAGGIGRGIATVFLQKGATVILGDKREEVLQEVISPLSNSAEAHIFARLLDVTSPESIYRLFDWAERKFGTVDILVNNAGVCYAHPFSDGTKEVYTDTVAVNFGGVLAVSKEFAKRLIQKKCAGTIVNIASNAAKRPYAYYIEYNATKAAISNITHTLSQELAP